MGSTFVGDVIEPKIFMEYVTQLTAEKSNLIASGIVRPDPVIDALADKGGRDVNMPFWNDLDGDDEVPGASNSTTDAALTPQGITAGQDIAVLHLRDKAWGVDGLAADLAGSDPMGVIADRFANWWGRKEQKLLINILDGVFASNIVNNSSDLVLDISIATGDTATAANKISAEAIVDAVFQLGDNHDVITAMCVHSVPYKNMVKQDLIDFIPDSQGNLTIPTYLGKRVLVDDGMPVTAAATNGFLYTTFFFAEGAVARGEGMRDVPVETDRDSLKDREYLIHRRKLILHPRGFKWNGASVAGVAPTNAECALAANWTRVYTQKNVRVVALVTNG